MSEEYSVGYSEGYQAGWNAAIDATPPAAQPATEESSAAQPAPVQHECLCKDKCLHSGSFGQCKGLPSVLAQPAPVQEPVAWMDGYRNIYSLEEKAAGCEDAVIPLVPAIQHWSDCAVHNEPAYQKGDCDCGGYTTPPAAQPAPVQEPDENYLSKAYRLANELRNHLSIAPAAQPTTEKSSAVQPAPVQRWAVFCGGCRKEWSVSYPHPGESICNECDAKLKEKNT